MRKILFFVIGIAMSQPHLSAQKRLPPQPLTIGDTVPDIELNNLINYPSGTARLSDFKGKLVILDFWGKYCSSCIRELPRLDSLHRILKDELQLITISDFDNTEEAKDAVKGYPFKRKLELPIGLTNPALTRNFPFKLVSHVVWINGSGVVIAITGTEYITLGNIRKILNKEPVNWPVKDDRMDFNYKEPLLGLVSTNLAPPRFLFYSTFTGHLAGVSTPYGMVKDPARKIYMVSFYNFSLLQFCQLALDYRIITNVADFVLTVKDSSRYFRKSTDYYSEWALKNTYCYSIVLPDSLSKDQVVNIVQADLIRWLSLLGIHPLKLPKNGSYNGRKKYLITETN